MPAKITATERQTIWLPVRTSTDLPTATGTFPEAIGSVTSSNHRHDDDKGQNDNLHDRKQSSPDIRGRGRDTVGAVGAVQ